MESEDEAKAAIAALDGYNVKGSQIHVEVGFRLHTALLHVYQLHDFCYHIQLPVIV